MERPLQADGAAPEPGQELCNRQDDDSDLQVDEDFRDDDGHYLDDAHCGGCARPCDQPLPNASDVGCALLAGAPTCVARACDEGFGLSAGGTCVPLDRTLCLPCRDDADCGTLIGARCETIGGEQRCARSCEAPCPQGYICVAGQYCAPFGESCTCDARGADFDLACSISAPDATLCAGQAACRDGVLSDCSVPAEACDGVDDDCDGAVDEDYIGPQGAYSESAENCGVCGADCTADEAAGVELTCGGDPFAPSCVVLCPDSLDGIQVGDLLDADRQVGSGCECTVRALVDSVGAPAAEGQLDSNCDGADGELLSSVYVTTGGSDADPGSPTRPLRTIQAAIDRARASLGSAQPRPDVFVASGTYTESLVVPGGVRLHGGYRRDFLSLDPDGFEVIVVAPADTDATGGAALTVRDPGTLTTLVEGFSFRGRDADSAGGVAVGVVIEGGSDRLTLRDLRIRTGKPGRGSDGQDGAAGGSPMRAAGDGDPQRAAMENTAHACIAGAANTVAGGRGGQNSCGGTDVSGGNGGAPACPRFASAAPAGSAGRSAGAARGGAGGPGGRDLSGPISGGDSSCASSVCCGLADFVVPSPFELPQASLPGDDGAAGRAGAPCTDPLGRFTADWVAGEAAAGTAGQPGGGGGGGGSGGGVEMEWVASLCEWPDGLAGSGGGGGAGGCGGVGGQRGHSGGGAIGVLLRVGASPSAELPVLERVEILVEDGAEGGRGGAGGDGGLGGSGGFGGRLQDARRTTPPLAGPLPGERGGQGGNGGAGGGGGGGCGGSSVGIWIAGVGAAPGLGGQYTRGDVVFELGAPGQGGEGGGGAAPAAGGASGLALEVLTR